MKIYCNKYSEIPRNTEVAQQSQEDEVLGGPGKTGVELC